VFAFSAPTLSPQVISVYIALDTLVFLCDPQFKMSEKIEGRRFNMIMPDDLRARLKAESARSGIPIVTLVRRAIDAAIPVDPSSASAPAPRVPVNPPVIAGPTPQPGQLYRWVMVDDSNHPEVEAVMLPVEGFQKTPADLTTLPGQPVEQRTAPQPVEHPVDVNAPASAPEIPAPLVPRRRRRKVRIDLTAKP
jgi:hypothetical protein